MTKYGKLKVSNLVTVGESRYLLIEIFRPSEGNLIGRQNYVARETTENSLEILDEFYLNDKISDDFVACCNTVSYTHLTLPTKA